MVKYADFVSGNELLRAFYSTEDEEVFLIENTTRHEEYRPDEEGNRPKPHLFTFAYTLFE